MLNDQRQVLIPDLPKVNNSIFDIVGSSKWDVWKAAAKEAYTDSPSA